MHKQWIKDGLSEYLSDAHAVWHMPGHKRKACYGDFQDAFLAWDVTEVPGTDDLYLPEGFIGDSLAMLKEIYQTCGTYYVVNGATGGIFTAIAACTKPGDAILIAKNCHKSVYNAAAMLQRQTIYVEPTWKKEAEDAFAFTSFIDGYVDADDLDRLCDSHPEIAEVVVTCGTCTSCSGDRGRSTWGTSAIFKTGIFCDLHGCRCRCTESAQDTSSDDADSGDSCLYRRTGETGGAGIGDILKFFAVVYFHDEYGSGNLLYGRP